MAIVLAFPILAGLTILQSTLLMRVPLLQGTPDLLLLAVIAWAIQPRVETGLHWAVIAGAVAHLTTMLPFGVPLAGYLLAAVMALFLRQRIWKARFLSMLAATLLGTIISLLISWGVLVFTGVSLPLFESLELVVLPSALLNLLLCLPVYWLARELAERLYPLELDA